MRHIIVVTLAFAALHFTLSITGAAQPVALANAMPRSQDSIRVLDETGPYTIYLPLVSRVVLSPSADLLYNGGFEGEYRFHQGNSRRIVAYGWTPWYTKERQYDIEFPEYKPAELSPDPLRVRTGERAQQYFSFWLTHIAGVYQRVMVLTDTRVTFSVWGHAWSSTDNSPRPSVNPTHMRMKIGIDPKGGTDPFDPGIVWSNEQNAIDEYTYFSVDAWAQGGRVTVFLHSAPDEPRKHNDVYWDDALLTALVPDGIAVRAPNPDATITFDNDHPLVSQTVLITASSAAPLTFIDLRVLTPDGTNVIPPYVGGQQEANLYLWIWNYTPPISGTYQVVFLADEIAPAWADLFVGE